MSTKFHFKTGDSGVLRGLDRPRVTRHDITGLRRVQASRRPRDVPPRTQTAFGGQRRAARCACAD